MNSRLNKLLKDESGIIMGIVMFYFVIFTILGGTMLMLAGHEGVLVASEIERQKSFYLAEGGKNIALWRMNVGSKSDGTFNMVYISAEWDSVTGVLAVTGTSGGKSTIVQVSLINDTPFHHLAGYTGSLFVGPNVDTSSFFGLGVEQFVELPIPDMSYYLSIADYYYDSNITFSDTLPPGIYYVDGNVSFKNGAYLEGTIVTTSGIKFDGHTEIHAQLVPGETYYYPAIIAVDSASCDTEVEGNPNLVVTGAIYGDNIDLMVNSITGPVVGTNVILKSNQPVTLFPYTEYYQLPPGFPANENWGMTTETGSWSIIRQ